MAKFTLEFKKEVSEKYLEDELSLKSVARMYGVSTGAKENYVLLQQQKTVCPSCSR